MERKTEHSIYWERYGRLFDKIPLKYVEIFDELDKILDAYDKLLCSNLEDLKLYALMYNNVNLSRNSIIDKAFFIKKENEIKTYADKTYSPNANIKEKVLKYYFEYDYLFEMYCKKQIGVDIKTCSKSGKQVGFTLEDYTNIQREQYEHETGIIDLSEEQCAILLDNISELETAATNDEIRKSQYSPL